jgi:NAD(P)-dependent dehydrogenase (short-subunit alcohol dehydrogenase family)
LSTGWLQGKVAVVTGASRGIGRATSRALAGAGARVILAARDEERLRKLQEEIAAAGGDSLAVPCDVSDPGSVEDLFSAAESVGPLSVLVCAAGILKKVPFEQLTVEDWNLVLGVNLNGTFLCCRRAFAAMKKGGGGRMVTISSLSGIYATDKFPGLAAYNASKNGVVGLSEGIAVEGRDYGISILCISPGAVDTQMLREANSELRPGLVPDDVARLIIALLDDAMAPASGANIPLFSNR